MAHRRLVPAAALLVAASFALAGCGSKKAASSPFSTGSSAVPAGTTATALSAGLDCKVLTPELAATVLPDATQDKSSGGQSGCSYSSRKDQPGDTPIVLTYGYGQFPPSGKPKVSTVFRGLRTSAKFLKNGGFQDEKALGDSAYSIDQKLPGGAVDVKVQWVQGRRLYALELRGYSPNNKDARAKLVAIAEKLVTGGQ